MSTGATDLPDLSELRTLVARLRQETETIRTSMEEIGVSVRDQLQESREERDRALAGLAAAARAGELGDPGHRLARRIDDGETSWLAVLHERDPDPDAAALRRSAGTAVQSLVDRLAEQDPQLRRTTGRDEGGSPRDHSP